MCFDDRRRRREVDLICECREVRFDRDFRNRRDFNRNDDFRCRCREINRRRDFFSW